MKVDYLYIHFFYFKNSMIPSRTKHESFDSFGSHAQLFLIYWELIPIYIFFSNVMSLPSPSLLYSYSNISKLITNPRPEYSEDSSDQHRKYIKKLKSIINK